jgi:hypothetical protein
MPKRALIPLPDKVAAELLQALAAIDTVRNDRLVLQRPDHDRRPEMDRTKDYRAVAWTRDRTHLVPRIHAGAWVPGMAVGAPG